MKYNEKYGRWFTKGGLVYRYSRKQHILVLCKQSNDKDGYKRCHDYKHIPFRVHRAVYETFVGEIPNGYQIDHINTIKDDNSIGNLRAVTPKENTNNPLTLQHRLNKPKSEFGRKYFEHFGYGHHKNPKQHNKEKQWFYRHGKCSWE